MADVQINIPEELYNSLTVLGYKKKEIEREVLEDVVIQLYAKHAISIGKAASILGMTIHSFRERLLKRHLPVEYLTEQVYEEDLKAIETAKG